MKTTHWYFLISSSLILLIAQPLPADTPQGEAYSISDRGPHHRVWERTEYETIPGGQQIPHLRSYTELATGMHYTNESGAWVESKEEIQILPNGAGAKVDEGQHKVIFPPNLYDGMIEMSTPDNKWLRSRALGLGYFDSASGQSVLIAEITNSVGELHAPNVMIYPNAFADLPADVRCAYTRAGFEQDIILRVRPPSPTEYGLNPETTRLQVLTEFFSPPEPTKQARQIDGLTDETLDFGVMRMGRGKAFALGNETDPQRSVRIMKTWQQLEGRNFLIEEVQYQKIEQELQQLPPSQAAVNRKPTSPDSVLHRVVTKRVLPAQRLARQSTNTFQVAKADIASRPGYVLDYTTINGNLTDYTFQSDTTYRVTGTVYLSGTTTIEGGTVIKFFTNSGWGLFLYGPLKCQTSTYRPAVCTSTNDNSVGESFGTGNPARTKCDYFANEGNSMAFTNVMFRYANEAAVAEASLTFSDCQFVNCSVAFDGQTVQPSIVRNALVSQCLAVSPHSFAGEHVTFDQCGSLIKDSGVFAPIYNGNAYLTNCILTAVTNITNSTLQTCVRYTNDTGVYQTVGAGNYYLSSDSTNRNAGTTNINASLLAGLKAKTTYPPMMVTNITISADTSLSPQAQRDTDAPDLGYHYDPIDYMTATVYVTNATLTLGPGTVIATIATNGYGGIWPFDYSQIVSVGTPLLPNWFIRAACAQEQPVWFGDGTDVLPYRWGPAKPNGTFQFTKFACLSKGGTHLYHYSSSSIWAFGNLLVEDCEFYNGENNFSGHTNSVAILNNNLFHRSQFTATGSGTGGSQSSLSLSNNLFFGILPSGNPWGFEMTQPSGTAWNAFNNAFDTMKLRSSCTSTNGYNAYITSSNRFTPTNINDIVLSSAFAWQSGPLGDFYHPTNSVLIDEGDVGADVQGLYHFTTLTNQTKETTSTVDIGYHYVAVDSNGKPLDYDTDGVPDYLEDGNGNGIVNSGETDWQGTNDPGLKVFITRPRDGSTVP